MHLVVLPGLDGTGDLLARFQAVAPDGVDTTIIPYPPDQRLSYPEYVEYVRSRLPADRRFFLLAESFSGPVGISIASETSEDLAGLILCNTFAYRPAWTGFRFLPWSLLMRIPIPNWLVGLLLVGPRLAEEWTGPVQAALEQPSPQVLARRMQSVLTVDVRDKLTRTKLPILTLRGSQDVLVGKGALRRIRDANPAVQVQAVNSPHFLLQTAPEEAWHRILRYMKRTAG